MPYNQKIGLSARSSYDRKARYKAAMNYICANPDCESGITIGVHHIIPRNKGGHDEYSNYITLCAVCHHSNKNRWHKNYEQYAVELRIWKFYLELTKLGFTSDCSNIEFNRKLSKFCSENNVK